MTKSTTFGPFTLVETIGKGGMGVVYRARHRRAGTPAALKVLTAGYAARERYRRAFRREAQALAKLNHPGIATILDFGTISGGVETPDGSPLPEKTPWLAMEFVDGATLSETVGDWQWPQVEDFLLGLLDALAHAHANDVIHRDLKPSNLLIVEGETDGEIGVKLLDFGIADLRDEVDGGPDDDRIRGTPKYMAPEQVLAARRDQGPGTDLYAVGCLIWRLLCRQAPFTGQTTRETLQRHLANRPSRFDPVIDVPDGLHDWLRRMLVKDPDRRFQRAADAAWSLVRLTPPSDSKMPRLATTGSLTTLSPEEVAETASTTVSSAIWSAEFKYPEGSEELAFRGGATTVTTPSSRTMEIEERLDDENAEAAIETIAETLSVEPEPPPLPEDWRRGASLERRPPVAGGGLELFGLRTIPLVGRHRERDLLWDQLATVRQTESPRMVLLDGPPGSGKSRIVEWLGRRVRELGVAQQMKATHSRTESARDGIGPMFGRHFGYLGITWMEAFERLRDALGRLGVSEESIIHDAAGLLEMVDLPREITREVTGFQSRREAHVAIRRILQRVAQDRPLILWLDDLPWSRRSIELARFLLDHPPEGSFPVLVLGTGRREAFDEYAERTELLDRSDGAVTWMEVPPLERANLRQLIEQTLELDEQLVDEIIERTEGTPLFAIQLLGEWVERGVLTDGPDGFVLSEPGDVSMPEDLQQLWSRRLAAVVDPLGGDARPTIEVAATLGKQVVPEEWLAACTHLGLNVPRGLEETLIEAGLAEPTGDDWRFTHQMLVEAIRREADRDGRLADIHRAIARTLEALYPDQRKQTALRRAEHWERSGEPAAALEPLGLAALHLKEVGEYRDMMELLDWREGLMDELGLAEEDRRRLQTDIMRASVHNRTGEATRARALLDWAEGIVRREGWRRELGEVLLERARLEMGAGEIEAALEACDAAQPHYEEAGARRGLARTHLARGNILKRRGAFQEASLAYDRAVELFEQTGDASYKVDALQKKLTVWVAQDRFEDVWEAHPRLLEHAQSIGARNQEAALWNTAGEVARFEGRWRRARGCYRRARDIWTELDSRIRHIAALNLAMVDLGAGRLQEAQQRFTRLESTMRQAGLPSRLLRVYLGLAGCAAGQHNWQLWDRAIARVEQQLADNQDRNTDDPWLAELAADHAAEAGNEERAEAMYAITRRIWHDLDAPERAEELKNGQT